MEDASKFAYDYQINFDFPQNRFFKPTAYDLFPTISSSLEENVNTTTRDNNVITIVDNISNLEYEATFLFSGGDGVHHSTAVGRAAAIDYVLKVNGGDTISLNQNIPGLSISYAVK